MSHDSTCTTLSKKQNYKERKLITGCQGLGLGERLTTKKHERIFGGGDYEILDLDCGVIT